MSARADAIRKILESSPNDPFVRYGLAMEHKISGENEPADQEFTELERRSPDYAPQYLMHFQVLLAMGRRDDARALAERGLAAIRKKGDGHALGELQNALDLLDQE